MENSQNFKIDIIIFILIGAILVGGGYFLAHNNKGEKNILMSQSTSKLKQIRQPAVAGQFYPADEKELGEKIDDFLNQADLLKNEGQLLCLIVPHAGYEYSGQVAAWGYKQLLNSDFETVILIGNSHRQYFDGAAVETSDFWQTPLGEVEIDKDLAERIIKEDKLIKADIEPHRFEHSLEVQVPFLQRVLKNFKIVPILLGNKNDQMPEILAKAISRNIKGKKILIVASSDMSHYPSYEAANYADQKVLEAILTGKVENLKKIINQLVEERIYNAQTFLCAQSAVETLMQVAKGEASVNIKLLKYSNSGDTPVGDRSAVVGYGVVGFYGQEEVNGELNVSQQKRLLEIARQSVESYIKTGRLPILDEKDEALNQKLGVFVTLKKDDQLRGCIGNFTGDVDCPLWENTQKMAIAAAVEDPRFLPVKEEELNDLEYEISVLGPLKKIDDYQQIKLGIHGVKIKQGYHSGVFLPQVASETGWDLETFLGQLCSQKAGLSWNCWQDPKTDLYIFTAQVFRERNE